MNTTNNKSTLSSSTTRHVLLLLVLSLLLSTIHGGSISTIKSSSPPSSSIGSSTSSTTKQPSISKLIEMTNKLTLYIQNEQSQQDLPFKFELPIVQFAEQEGLYKSYIHMNNGGYDWESNLLRRHAKIPDLNMFVTNFVVLTQIESNFLLSNSKYRNSFKSDEILNLESLSKAISAILTYKDKNYNSTLPVYNFWPQKLLPKQSTQYYQAYPINLIEPLNEFGSMEVFIEKLLKFLKLDHLLDRVEGLIQSFQYLAQAFHIPADYDDTSCNLVLGAMLNQYISKLDPKLNDLWKSKNINYDGLFKIYESFAFTLKEGNNNTKEGGNTIIDPRSYYIFHEFFENSQNLKLPMTWLMNTQQDRTQFPFIAQPFNVNNIDLSVLTNFLFGVSAHTLSGAGENGENNENSQLKLLELHPLIQQMMLNASKIIEYSIENDLESKRPDLSLVYYPSVYDFYWFVSRTSFLLRNSNITNNSNSKYSNSIKTLQLVSSILYNTLTKHVTYKLLKLAKQQQKDQVYWDDFLGDFKPNHELGEDRLFSTSLALSALLDTWTELSPTGNNQRIYNQQTPQDVKSTIDKGILYLQENFFGNSWFSEAPSYENAFFSGSVKDGAVDYPFFYPMNYCEYLNGTKLKPIDPNQISDDLIVGVEGSIDDKTYQVMMKQLWFNSTVPVEFDGFEKAQFPYWSSPALTYSITQLVFAKYLSLN